MEVVCVGGGGRGKGLFWGISARKSDWREGQVAGMGEGGLREREGILRSAEMKGEYIPHTWNPLSPYNKFSYRSMLSEN